ncbi:SigE family RNA polymerase sigma factor [Streptomyces sp. NPDC056944]|uniref:SigE family RNA polymerase sigma factor n=1 Tax=Streptomyces sp. NPDC056944 TaxID=3345972 RepID=UPI0036350049
MTVEEFEEFYAHAVARLTGQLYVMLGDLHEAQDVVQEAFVKGWDRRRQLDRDGRPEAWIRTVAWRLAVSRWRFRRRSTEAWRRGAPPPTVEGPGPDHLALVEALRGLPPQQRRTLALHYLCDMSVDQVAAETGLSTGTVKTHLSRGRAALAHRLEDPRGAHPHAGEPRGGRPHSRERPDARPRTDRSSSEEAPGE